MCNYYYSVNGINARKIIIYKNCTACFINLNKQKRFNQTFTTKTKIGKITVTI